MFNENFPRPIRGRAVGVTTAVNWGAGFLIRERLLPLTGFIGDCFIFRIFVALSEIDFVRVNFSQPDTRSRSLEGTQKNESLVA